MTGIGKYPLHIFWNKDVTDLDLNGFKQIKQNPKIEDSAKLYRKRSLMKSWNQIIAMRPREDLRRN